MNQKKILISLVVLVIIAGSIGMWFYTRDTVPKTIRIASGSKGGEYYQIGEELEEKLIFRTRSSVENRETAGTLENLRLLKKGEVELALLTQATIFPELDHEGANKISVIAPLYLEPVVVLARKKSGIESVYDLENRPVCTGPKESGTKETSDDLLKFYGLKKVTRVPEFFHDNSNHNDISSCDAGIIVMGLRGPCFKEIGETDMRVLELPYAQVLAESKAFLTEFRLPKESLQGIPYLRFPIKTFRLLPTQLCSHIDVSLSSAVLSQLITRKILQGGRFLPLSISLLHHVFFTSDNSNQRRIKRDGRGNDFSTNAVAGTGIH